MSYSEYKQRRQEGVWHILNRLLFVLCVFAVVALIICCSLPLVKKLKDFSNREDDLKRQVAAQTQLLKLRTRQIEWLKDPDYVETLARDRLDLMKPGETILRLEPPASSAGPGLKPKQQ